MMLAVTLTGTRSTWNASGEPGPMSHVAGPVVGAGSCEEQHPRRECPNGDVAAVTIERRGVARQLPSIAEGHGRAAPGKPDTAV